MEQVGQVIKIFGNKAQLEIRRTGACGNCKGCSASSENKAHVVILKNNIDAKVGDLVEISGEPKNILKYTFIAYMIPFIFLVVGIMVSIGYFKNMGNENYEILSFLVGLASLVVSLFLVKLIDNKIADKDEDAIRMTRII